MRLMKLILILVAVQVCALGAVATFLSGCEQARPEMIGPSPTISNLKAMPMSIRVGDTATISGSAGPSTMWTLEILASSTAQGKLSDMKGEVNISSIFTASSVGTANIQATASYGPGRSTSATVSVTVVGSTEPLATLPSEGRRVALKLAHHFGER